LINVVVDLIAVFVLCSLKIGSNLPLTGHLVLRAPKPKADGEGETGA